MRIIIHDLNNIDFKDTINMNYDDIHNCIGCFNCWTNTPMKCIFNDKCKESSKLFLDSSELIIVSKCIYGNYSSKVKMILERNIGYVLPYFCIRKNEIHHKMRNNNKINLKVIFYGDISQKEKDLTKELINRNKLNFNYNNTDIFYLKNEMEARCKLNDFIY